MAFLPVGSTCIAGCPGPDTTACIPQTLASYGGGYAADSSGYNPYGYLGSDFKDFIYASDTGAMQIFTPGADGRFYFQDMLDFGTPLPIYKTLKQKSAAVSYLLFNDVDINQQLDIDFPENNSGLGGDFLRFRNVVTPTGEGVKISPYGDCFIWAEEDIVFADLYVGLDTATNTITVRDLLGNKIDPNHPTYRGKFIVGDVIKIMAVGDKTTGCCPDIVVVDVIDVTLDSNGLLDTITYDADASGNNFGPAATQVTGAFDTTPTQTYANWAAYVAAGGLLNRNTFPSRISVTITAADQPEGIASTFTTGAYPGDKVSRWGHPRDPCTPIVSSAQSAQQGWVWKRANVKYYARTIDVPYEVKNIQYANGGAKQYLGRQVQLMLNSLVEEHAQDFYISTDRARYRAGSKGPSTSPSVLSVLTRGAVLHPELGLIRSAANAATPEEKAWIFLEMLETMQQSLVTPNNPTITCVFDDTAYYTFNKLNKAFSNLIGEIRIATDIEVKNFAGVKKVQTIYGNMEIMKDYYFSRVTGNTGNVLFLCRDLIGGNFLPRRNVELGANGKLSLLDVTPGLQIQDVTPVGVHGCQKYDMRFNAPNIFIYGDRGAIMLLTGFNLGNDYVKTSLLPAL